MIAPPAEPGATSAPDAAPAPAAPEAPASSESAPAPAEPTSPSDAEVTSPAPEEVTGSGDPATEPNPDLSHTAADPAEPTSEDGTQIDADAYRAWFNALPVHEQAKILGVPEDRVREGHVYFDEADGHGKFKDWESFFKSREANDRFVTETRAQREEREAKIAEFEAQTQELRQANAQQQAVLKALYSTGDLNSDEPHDGFVQMFMPDEFKGVQRDDLVEDDARRRFDMAEGVARDKARQRVKDILAEADAATQREADLAKAGADYFEAKVKPSELGLTSYDDEARFTASLSKSVGDGITVADVIRDLGAVFPDVADMALKHMAMEARVLTPLADIQKPAPVDQQQEDTKPAPEKAQAGQGTSPAQPSAPSPPEPRVVENNVTSTATPPIAPGGAPPPEPKDGFATIQDALARRQR